MSRRTQVVRAAAGALSAAVIAGAAFAPAVHAAPRSAERAEAVSVGADSPAVRASSASSSVRFVDIPGAGSVRLAANVATPAGAGDGRTFPVLVFPTSWAVPQVEYLAQAQRLADRGYVVVSYNARGFWQSGGEIEVAGPQDVADASKVIDWALAHTPADPERVGMGGVSYGAGISLLAAGADPRVRTVAALSGWADLVGSIYGGRTQHQQAAAFLTGAGYLTGRPSAETARILDGFLGGSLDQEAEMIAWGKKRSPAADIDRINANGAAIMLANAWGDSIFPPDQYADFYGELTGPKRLEFRPGDHATAEATGLLGLPNDVWTDTERWFDHHLKGVDNGIDREQPVQVLPRTGGGYEGRPNWKAVADDRRRIPLGGTERFRTDVDSGANGGTVLLSSTLDQLLHLPPTALVPLLPRAFAAVWQTGTSEVVQRVRGAVRLHTTLTADASDGTAVAYLYDVGPLGLGKLVTHAPVTFHGKEPGKPFGVDLRLSATAYDVPAGHRLALVVDGQDPLYREHNPRGAELTFSSPAADPSWLDVPLRTS